MRLRPWPSVWRSEEGARGAGEASRGVEGVGPVSSSTDWLSSPLGLQQTQNSLHKSSILNVIYKGNENKGKSRMEMQGVEEACMSV